MHLLWTAAAYRDRKTVSKITEIIKIQIMCVYAYMSTLI